MTPLLREELDRVRLEKLEGRERDQDKDRSRDRGFEPGG
jgi:hypothetical protein